MRNSIMKQWEARKNRSRARRNRAQAEKSKYTSQSSGQGSAASDAVGDTNPTFVGDLPDPGVSDQSSRIDHQHAFYQATGVTGLPTFTEVGDGVIAYTTGDDKFWGMVAGSWEELGAGSGGADLSDTAATRLHGENTSAGTGTKASRDDHVHAIYNASTVTGLDTPTHDGAIGYTRSDDQLWVYSGGGWIPALRFT